MPEIFVMPRVCVGKTVLFYEDADTGQAPFPGIVQKVNDRSVTLRLVAQVAGVNTFPNVRHVGDPQLSNPVQKKYGCWDFIEDDKEIRQVLANLNEAGLGIKPAEPAKKTDAK